MQNLATVEMINYALGKIQEAQNTIEGIQDGSLPAKIVIPTVEELPSVSNDSELLYYMDDLYVKLNGEYKQLITNDELTSTIQQERTAITAEITAAITAERARNYGVGSYYISDNPTSPSSLYGGEWEQIEGQMLLGASATYAAGSTGGEASVTLDLTQMPRHRHGIGFSFPTNDGGNNLAGTTNDPTSYGQYTQATGGVDGGELGSCKAHNNMPPYFAVYIWHRVS